MSDRLPPQDLDAERAVLGSCLLGPDALDWASPIVSARDFYSPSHRIIFDAMVALHEAGKPIDLITLRAHLAGDLESVGGLDALIALLDVVPSGANVEHYAEIVREKAVLRELIAAGSDILETAYAGGAHRDILDAAESRIMAVAHEVDGTGPVESKVAIPDSFDRLGKPEMGVLTGLIDLDNMTSGLQRGELIVVAGRPSAGKTSLALNVAEHAALSGTRVLIFSLEMGREQVLRNLICSHAQVDSQRLRRGLCTPAEWQFLSQSAEVLSGAPLLIDDTSSLTVLEIRARARWLHRRRDLGLIVVDYLQLLTAGGRDRQQEVSAISRALKVLARELNVPVLVVSQLSRGPEAREDHRPRMSDLRDSGSIEQDADLVLLIYREEYYQPDAAEHHGKAEINVAKQRSGPTGIVRLWFDATHTRFRSQAPERLVVEQEREWAP